MLPESWITPDELHGAIWCLFFPSCFCCRLALTFQTCVVDFCDWTGCIVPITPRCRHTSWYSQTLYVIWHGYHMTLLLWACPLYYCRHYPPYSCGLPAITLDSVTVHSSVSTSGLSCNIRAEHAAEHFVPFSSPFFFFFNNFSMFIWHLECSFSASLHRNHAASWLKVNHVVLVNKLVIFIDWWVFFLMPKTKQINQLSTFSWLNKLNKLTTEDNTISYRLTLFMCGGPCLLSSLKPNVPLWTASSLPCGISLYCSPH